ncbi:MAG: hypothetical protein WC845_03530 [Candidatus Staskawiczbacteria bacterium]|jgi:hypothetical protein
MSSSSSIETLTEIEVDNNTGIRDVVDFLTALSPSQGHGIIVVIQRVIPRTVLLVEGGLSIKNGSREQIPDKPTAGDTGDD